MRGIYTPVTDIRRKVFTEVARMAYEVNEMRDFEYLMRELPFKIIPGEEKSLRSSIFLERAIVSERVRLAMGMSLRPLDESVPATDGLKESISADKYYEPPLINVIKFACNACPEKIIKVAYCPMTPEQQRWYNQLLADARGRIGDMVKEKGFAKSRMEILALLMRLRQVASHLELLKEYREKASGSKARGSAEGLSGKLEVFFEMLDEAIDGGHRVLVFSQFVSMLTILRRELEARGISYCYLDGETKDRLGACRKFNTDESIPLFLISLHAGGTGLNLTGADMVIHFDPWWTPAVEAQATDRAHRIGQKRTVYVVKMIAENSVEERVLALQQKKQLVIDATVGTTDEAAVQKLTYDDIKSIVGL